MTATGPDGPNLRVRDADTGGVGGSEVPRVRWRAQLVNVISELAAKGGLVAIIDQVVASTTNLVTGIVIGRACTKDEFGLYMLGFSIIFTVLGLQTALITAPYTVYGARASGRDHARYTGSTLLHQFGVSLVGVVGLILAALYVSAGNEYPGLGRVLWTLVFVFSFILLKEFARRVCFADLEFKMALVVDIGVSVVQLTGLVLLASFNLISAVTALWMVGGAAAVAGIGWLATWRHRFIVEPGHVVEDLRRNWSIGKWAFLSVLLWTLSNHIYPWILAVFHGTAPVGVWAACLGVIAIANPVLLTAENFIGPRLSHAYASEGFPGLKRLVARTGVVFSVIMAPFCIMLLAAGGWIAVLFYGEKYSGNGLVISLLGLNVMVTLIGIPLSRGLFALERADLDFVVNFVPLAVMILIGIPLAGNLGTVGAGYGLLIGNLTGQGTRALVFAKLRHATR